jgi:hypothetical protein
MCYAYGKRFVGKETSLVLELREELFSVPYDQVNWDRARNECAKEDLYYPHPLVQVCTLRTRWTFATYAQAEGFRRPRAL